MQAETEQGASKPSPCRGAPGGLRLPHAVPTGLPFRDPVLRREARAAVLHLHALRQMGLREAAADLFRIRHVNEIALKKLSKISHDCKVDANSWYDPKGNLQGNPRMPRTE